MAAGSQGRGAVQQFAGPLDNLGTTNRVVTTAFLGTAFFRDRISAVQGIVQATPTGVGSVQGKTGVHDRHNQLRAGHGGDFRVYVGGRNFEIRRLVNQVTDLLQERLVLGHVQLLAFMVTVPGVHFFLDLVALDQQVAVARSQLVHNLVELGPEFVSVNAGTRDRFVVYEIVQILGDLNAANLNAFCHRCLPRWVMFPDSPLAHQVRGH